jgi:hypothetical protein
MTWGVYYCKRLHEEKLERKMPKRAWSEQTAWCHAVTRNGELSTRNGELPYSQLRVGGEWALQDECFARLGKLFARRGELWQSRPAKMEFLTQKPQIKVS